MLRLTIIKTPIIQPKHIGEAIFLTGRKGGFKFQRLAGYGKPRKLLLYMRVSNTACALSKVVEVGLYGPRKARTMVVRLVIYISVWRLRKSSYSLPEKVTEKRRVILEYSQVVRHGTFLE